MWTCLQSVYVLSSDPVVCILSGLDRSKFVEYALDSAPVSFIHSGLKQVPFEFCCQFILRRQLLYGNRIVIRDTCKSMERKSVKINKIILLFPVVIVGLHVMITVGITMMTLRCSYVHDHFYLPNFIH